MYFIRYWRTQWILKKKWFLNHWLGGRNTNFSRFIILCDPRTGSTWLHTLLNSHPSIQSYGEVLTERDLSNGLQSTIWKAHHQSIKSIGCKIFYAQLGEPGFDHILEEVVSDTSIKIIDLNRENALETFVSLKLAQGTKVWSTTKPTRRKSQKIRVDKEELQRFYEETNNNRRKILDHLRGHERLSVSYESLQADLHKQLAEIQVFLGVPSRKLFSLLRKQRSAQIKETVENIADFSDQFYKD